MIELVIALCAYGAIGYALLGILFGPSNGSR